MLVLAASTVLAATLWFPVVEVTGSSMAPSLESGQVVLTLRTSEPEPGDITVFYHENQILVRRMIAGAGDWIDINDTGTVFVNGEKLEEPYLQRAVLRPSDLTYPYQVPDGCIFVMGDNRAISMDSRLSEIGPVSCDRILGKILFRIWPLKQLEYLG
jgi:signal peptidase I